MGEPALPANQPVLASDGTQTTQPNSGLQTSGYPKNYSPDAWEHNWLFKTINDWVTAFLAKMLIQPGAQAPTDLTITSNQIIPTAGSHSFASSGTVNLISTANHNPGRLIRLHGKTGQSVVLGNNTGSAAGYLPITTADGDSITLNTEQDIVELRLNAGGTFWRETFRSASLVGAGPPVFEARLTLASGVPITTTDQTGATTIYLTPFKGGQVSLWDGVKWMASLLAEISITVPATTSQMYDLFLYLSGGVLTLEAVAWTNDTTRATTLTLQNGIYCKTGALTHRYVGSFRTTGSSGQTEDSIAKRYLWNCYNRVERPLLLAAPNTSHSYTNNTWRQYANSATYQLEMVVGLVEDVIKASLGVLVDNGTGGAAAMLGIGLNSTTTPTGKIDYRTVPANSTTLLQTDVIAFPALGWNVLAWLEASQTGSGSFNWFDTETGAGVTVTSTMQGSIAA